MSLRPKSKVYIKLNQAGIITSIDGGYTADSIVNIAEWILIDEGYGDKYNLCQNNYLPLSIRDERGVYRYKFVDDQIVERTQEEMDADVVIHDRPNEERPEIATLQAQVNELQEQLLAAKILLGVE